MAQAEEKGWTLDSLTKAISSLEAKNRLNPQEIMQYVITPYVASLGYNIFDIEQVDTNVDSSTTNIVALPSVNIVISLNEYFPNEDNDKIFVVLDTYKYSISLFMKALGEWELLLEASLRNPEDVKSYNNIRDYIHFESLKHLYNSKQERLFTEGVLNRKLANKEFDNAFVRAIIKSELEKPSTQFLQVIAQGLNKQFSTASTSTLAQSLAPLNKEGVVQLFGDVIEDIHAYDDYNSGSYIPRKSHTHANIDNSERFIQDEDTSEVFTQDVEKEYDTLSEKDEEGAYLSLDDMTNESKLNLRPSKSEDIIEGATDSLENMLGITDELVNNDIENAKLDSKESEDDADGEDLSAMFKMDDY